MKLKLAMCLTLSICLLICSSCSTNASEVTSFTSGNYDATEYYSVASGTVASYYTTCCLDMSYVDMDVQDNTVLLLGYQLYDFVDESIPAIGKIDMVHQTAEIINLVLPSTVNLLSISICQQEIWILYELEANGEMCGYAAHVDSDGTITERIKIAALPNNIPFSAVENFLMQDGIYMTFNDTLFVYDCLGTYVSETSFQAPCVYLQVDQYRNVLAITSDGENVTIVDVVSSAVRQCLTAAESAVLTAQNTAFVWGKTELRICYEGKEITNISLEDLGITSTPLQYAPIDDYIVFPVYDSSDKLRVEYVKLTEGNETKTTLTVAIVSEPQYGYFRKLVHDFNLLSEDYYIEIIDYTTEIEPLQAFSEDLLSGNIPDIYYLDGVPYEAYAEQGAFLDLYSIMDERLQWGEYLSGVLHAFETDGKLYRISPTIMLGTIVSKMSYKVPSDSFASFWSTWESYYFTHPDSSFSGISNKDFLRFYLAASMEEFVDTGARNCEFDGDTFKQLLNCIKDLENESDHADRIERLKMLNDGSFFCSLWSYSDVSAFTEMKTILDDFSLVGYPPYGPVCIPVAPIAFSSVCSKPDGLIEFLTYILGEEYQSHIENYFPIHTQALYHQLSVLNGAVTAYDPDLTAYTVTKKISLGSSTANVVCLSTDDVSNVINHFNSIGGIYAVDDIITSIVLEETERYFSDEATVDEVTEVIQNRVMIYLSE